MNVDKPSIPTTNGAPPVDTVPVAGLLSGGGEMGRLVRTRDWSQTPLGAAETWPPGLFTTLNIVLNSRFPMLLFWGEELVCFYNDAFRPSLGTIGKHPAILGLPARLAFPENWHVIGPLLNRVMDSSESVWQEDLPVPLQRDGQLQETHWTFSYSPVTDETGQVVGVFVACTETTAKVAELKAVRSASQRFADMVMQAPVAIAVFRGPDFIAEIANDAYLPLVDKTRDEFIGKPMFESVPSVRATIEPLVREVVHIGKSMRLQEIELSLRRQNRDETCWFNLIYEPLREADGTVDGFMVTATEVTTQVLARRQAEQKEAELRKARDQFELSIAAGNVGLWHWDVQNQVLNWSRQQEALYGLAAGEFGGTLADFHRFVLPEDLTTMFGNPALNLERSGELAYEFRIRRKDGAIRWIQARSRTSYNENGVLEYMTGINIDITEQRRAEQALRQATAGQQQTLALLESLLRNAPVGFAFFDKQHRYLRVNQTLARFNGIPAEEHLGQTVEQLLPTDIGQATGQMLDNVLHTKQPMSNIEFVGGNRAEPDKPLHCLTSFYPVLNTEGEADFVGAVVTEISSLKKTEQALRESEEKYRNLFESMDQGFCIVEVFFDEAARPVDYLFLECNRVFSQQTGLVDPVGKTARQLVPNLEERWFRIYGDVALSGHTQRFVEGSEAMGRWFEVYASRLGGADSRRVGILFTDITKNKQSEDALRESENRLRLALDSANTGIHVWNIAENTMDWDGRLREIWGIGPNEDVNYEVFANGLHPEDLLKMQAAVNQSLDPQGNGQYVAEYRVVNQRTAAIRWVLATGHVFFENGVPVRMVGTARDITESTEAAEKLRESESRFRVLAESLPQMVWMSDASGRVEYASGRWEEYLGIENSQQAWNTRVHPDDREPIMAAWGKHFAAGLPFRHEVRLQHKNGEYRWHYSIAEPVKNERGEIVRWIGALTDIHDQKTFAEKLEREVAEHTRELAAANEELTRSNHDLQQFAHVTSHDLQEPLRKIKIFAGLLQNEPNSELSEQGLLYLDKVRHATERMQAMIDGVLTYSKVRGSSQNVESVDLNTVIADVCNDLEVLIGQKNARIEADSLPTLPGSRVLLHQLFYNLINNALKFSKPAVPSLVVVRSLPFKSGTVAIEVRDNGIGFEPEYAERIFDTFVRLNSKDAYEGTGLGLALCKKIVQRHGGDIRATASPGQGAVFTVTLPLQQVSKII